MITFPMLNRIMNRRSFIVLSLTLCISGCGFKLRGSDPTGIHYVYLQMNTNSFVGSQIKRRIQSEINAEIVENRAYADIIVSILDTANAKYEITYNDYGEIRDNELLTRIKVRIESPEGKVYLSDTWFQTTDIYPYSRTQFLSREHEDRIMFRSMENELVNQIMNCIHNIRIK